METTIVLPESKESELAQTGSAIVTESKTYLAIRDNDHRDLALAFCKRVKTMRGMVGELFDDPISQAHKLHKSLCSRRNVLDGPLEEAEKSVNRGIGGYETKKRAEIEAKRQAELVEARKIAEAAERERQAQIAEARRIEEEKRLAQALALEAQGKSAQAAQVIAAPVIIKPPPPVAMPVAATPRYEAPSATTVRQNWKSRIVDATLIPREWLIPDEQAIGAYARSMKEKASIPGVEFYSEASASLR